MEQLFNKLVRDKIPNKIESNGEVAITRILSDDEYKNELYKKLLEESHEVINSQGGEDTLEELADVLNYCILMADVCGLDMDEIIQEKIKNNNEKYPVEKAKDSAKKYSEL